MTRPRALPPELAAALLVDAEIAAEAAPAALDACAIAARIRRDIDAAVEAGFAPDAGIDRETVDTLRRIPINDVALKLGYAGAIPRGSNAIDVTKAAGGVDYRTAVEWLHVAFPGGPAPALAPAAHATDLEVADRAKAKAVKQQLQALGAQAYRLTLMKRIDDKKIGRNLGRPGGHENERFYTISL